MARLASPTPSSRCQRGASLVESLIAFIVLAGGTVAVGHLQSQIRLDADIARQRSEAVRLGEAEIESLRAFSSLAAASGVRSYAAIGDADTSVAAGNAAYRIVRRIDEAAFTGAKSASVRVQWADRSGAAREVALASFIAGSDPAYAGALGLGAGTGAAPTGSRGALGRSPLIPLEARDLGNGRSVWKLAPSAIVVLVFDNTSGAIVARCNVAATTLASALSGSDLAGCTAGRSHLISGTIRFTSATPPRPAEANDAPPSVAVALTLTGGSYPAAASCSTEARKSVRYVAGGSLRIDTVAIDAAPASLGLAAWDDTGDRFVAWRCLVAARADGRWSGRADLLASGWTIGTGSGERRVCRYAADAARGDNVDVGQALTAQNFLVVRGDSACPAAPAVRLTGEGSVVYADLGTVAHQP